MVLSDVLGPIRRRWYILVLGLLLAGGVGWTTAAFAPMQYTARGLVMLLPSALTTGPKGNPLLNLGGLELPARVLIAYYSSEPAQSSLEKFAPKAKVQVSMEESTRGPIIAVDVTDSTPDGALRVLNHVTDSIPENLSRIQSEVGTPKQAAIGSMPLVLDTDAEPDMGLPVRLVIASSAAMLALTFFVLFFVDGLLLRRVSSADVETESGPQHSEGGDPTEGHAEQPQPPTENDLASERVAPTGGADEANREADGSGKEGARRALPPARSVDDFGAPGETPPPDAAEETTVSDPADSPTDPVHATRTLA